MRRFRNILVGVDLSHADRLADPDLTLPNREALTRAIWLAEKNSAELTIFSAVDISVHAQEMLHDQLPHVSRNVEDEALNVMDGLVAQAKGAGVSARRELRFGTPWEEVIRQVLRGGYDLAVVGARAHTRVGRILFGSTAMKILHNCPCPVWIAKPEEPHETWNVLVASDLSDVSLDALQMAVNLGQLLDTRTHVLHVVEHDLDAKFWRSYMQPEDIENYLRKKHNDSERQLHDHLAQTDYRTLPRGVQLHVVEGAADAKILEAIEQHQIDLLVMGTVARSGIPRLIVGNTAERLLPHVPCSVLAVKPEGFASPVTLE